MSKNNCYLKNKHKSTQKTRGVGIEMARKIPKLHQQSFLTVCTRAVA